MTAAIDHGSRAHATWSASSTARYWQCPGSLTLGQLGTNTSSIYADTGTAVHEISELCIRSSAEPGSYLGDTITVNGRDILFDEDCVESARTYVEYARDRIEIAKAQGGQFWLEERFSLADLGTPFEAGGTGDLVIYFPQQRLLEVADLKNGRGVVEAKENKQLRTYGLGALLAHSELTVENIQVTIIQPRAPHKDGRIRSETFHVADLIDWTSELLSKMALAKQAELDFAAVQGGVSMDDWAEKWLVPGNCTFCPAEGFCPALKRKAQAVAGIWFDDRDQPKIGNEPQLMSPEDLAATLDQLDMIESWIKAVRSLAHTQAEGGMTIPNYVLVDKIGNRAWAADEAKVIADLKNVVGLSDDEIYAEPKLRSVAQVEKVLGAKRKKEIENMYHRPTTGTNLVREDKTTRAPAKSKAERFFEEGK